MRQASSRPRRPGVHKNLQTLEFSFRHVPDRRRLGVVRTSRVSVARGVLGNGRVRLGTGMSILYASRAA